MENKEPKLPNEYQELLDSMPKESIIGRAAKYFDQEYLIIKNVDDPSHFILKNLSNGGGFATVQWGNFELLPEDYLIGRLAQNKVFPEMTFRIEAQVNELTYKFTPLRGLGGYVGPIDTWTILPALSTADKVDLFDRVVEWNKKRGNTTGTVFNEAKMLFEEVLELCGLDREQAKCESKKLAELYAGDQKDVLVNSSPEIQERVIDAATDMIFIATGAVFKADGKPKVALKKVCDANDWKGSKRDATGKIIKDTTFVEPVHIENNECVCDSKDDHHSVECYLGEK